MCMNAQRSSTRSGVRLSVCAAMVLASGACAQDSVSTGFGLPGDALDAYSTSQQRVSYIVDLASKTSSWGTAYALGPVVKASKSNVGGYFDLLAGSNALSARFAPSRALFNSGAYSVWTVPGFGVNTTANAAAGTISGAGKFGAQFGLGMLEFGSGTDGAFGTGDDENNIVGAVINFQTRNPNRLWVTRVMAIHNKTSASASGTASLGMGAVDELGNLHVYADNFGMTTPLRLAQRELERVRLAQRSSGSLNVLSQAGASDAPSTTRVRINQTSMTVPNIMPELLAGGAGRPVMIATDFASQFIRESAPGTTTTGASPGGSPRGSVAFVPKVYGAVSSGGAGGAVGTAATLVRTDGNTKTRGVQVFGLDSSGGVTSSMQLVLPVLPAQITDLADGFSPGATYSPITNHEFTNYASQASFRGAASQVAMTVLTSGELMVAALVAATGGGSAVPQGQDNYIAVARVPAGGGTPTWTIAAHTGAPSGAAGGTSKAILGRVGNGPLLTIGRIAKYTEVFGSASTGPSISSPAIDRAGNVYFMSTVSLDNQTGGQTLTTGLIRANYNSTTHAYELELLAQLGDVVSGLNSGRNYQIQFMGVADADSVDSGSIFSGSVVQDGVPGASANPGYGSAGSLGALAFKAKIVYDVNVDATYADPSGAGGGSTSPDQAYNVVMVLMPQIVPGDFNRDGAKTVQDIFDFLAVWFAAGSGADYNGDGAVTVQDIFDFLNDWFQA